MDYREFAEKISNLYLDYEDGVIELDNFEDGVRDQIKKLQESQKEF